MSDSDDDVTLRTEAELRHEDSDVSVSDAETVEDSLAADLEDPAAVPPVDHQHQEDDASTHNSDDDMAGEELDTDWRCTEGCRYPAAEKVCPDHGQKLTCNVPACIASNTSAILYVSGRCAANHPPPDAAPVAGAGANPDMTETLKNLAGTLKTMSGSSAYSEPPKFFSRHADYKAWKNDLNLWSKMTSLCLLYTSPSPRDS